MAEELSSSNKSKKENILSSQTLQSIASVLNKITIYCVYITVALIPLFFWPTSFITQELPKQVLLLFLVGIGFVCWLAQMVFSSQIKIRKSLFDIFVLIFWGTQVIASIGSLNPYISIWGAYGRTNFSLITTTLFVLLYFVIVNNFNTKMGFYRLLAAFLSSAAAVAVISVMQVTGFFFLPFNVAKAKTFNTIGSLNALVMFLIPVLAICASLLFSKKSVMKLSLIVMLVVVSGLLIVLNVAGLWYGLIAGMLAAGVIAYLKKGLDYRWSGIVIAIVLISIVMIFSANFGLNLSGETVLPKEFANPITLDTVKTRPVFGTGPETFGYDFSSFRPKSINKTAYSTLEFDRANNDYFTAAATGGLLGLISYLALFLVSIVLLVSSVIEEEDEGDIYLGIGLMAALIAIAVNSLFFYTNTSSSFLIWVLFAFIALFRQKNRELETISGGATETRVFAAVFCVIGLALVVAGTYVQTKALAADSKYKSGLEKSAQVKTLKEANADLKRATKLNPNRDIYYLGVARVALIQANREGQKKKPDKDILKKAVAEAIDYGKAGVQINPTATNYESLAIIYRNAGLYVSNAVPFIGQNYLEAINLEPTNPYFYNGLGQALLTQKKYKEATQVLEKAIELDKDDPRFTDAYYNLGLVYKAQKKYDLATAQFDKVLKLQPDNQAAKKEKENITKIPSK
ncbi:MAG: tetratricopeptide repeat protein [Actinobacteria bacterium]|nr:MAG: tetratricopeptide repeat protein [Actinomycetota bacterium]